MSVIDKGKIVTICMSGNNCFTFQQHGNRSGTKIFGCTIIHYPCDTGDCWLFELMDGTQFSLNPTSKDFIGLEIEEDDGCPRGIKYEE